MLTESSFFVLPLTSTLVPVCGTFTPIHAAWEWPRASPGSVAFHQLCVSSKTETPGCDLNVVATPSLCSVIASVFLTPNVESHDWIRGRAIVPSAQCTTCGW